MTWRSRVLGGQRAWIVETEAGRRARAARSAAEENPPGKEVVQASGSKTTRARCRKKEQDKAETDVQATYSAIEILRAKDFAGYTEEELRAAQRFIDSLAWRLSQHATRRLERAAKRRPTSTCPPPSGAASASGARSSSRPGAGANTSRGR